MKPAQIKKKKGKINGTGKVDIISCPQCLKKYTLLSLKVMRMLVGALMEFINLHTRDVTIKKIKLVLHTDTNLDLTSYCM